VHCYAQARGDGTSAAPAVFVATTPCMVGHSQRSGHGRHPVDTPHRKRDLDHARDRYAWPPDNSSTVAVGAAVNFSQDGPFTSPVIAGTGAGTFDLADIGVYRVTFQVSRVESGQWMLSLDGTDLAYTVVGRATGTSQITATALVTTTTAHSDPVSTIGR
jgi:hypothetical protein